MEDDEELTDCESQSSLDSFCIDEVINMVLDDDDKRLCYLCRNGDGAEEVYDRSDLMDDGVTQRMVLKFEREYPPPWDPVCTFCNGDGCEECICDECERPCRHIHGVNYGCIRHPVV